MSAGDNRIRPALGLTTMVVSSLLLMACDAAATSPADDAPAQHGTVDVLYAGSLLPLMEDTLGPRFSAESGYRFTGVAGGSAELAAQIKGRIRRGDVFISASPAVDTTLEGTANGSWVSWYMAFARAPLVLAYNVHSSFAGAWHREPWYIVVTSPGFRLGRTDPTLDPKGRLAAEAVRQAATRTGEQALLQIVAGSGNVFPEETLLGRLEAGQLDAGFFYLDEARAAGLPTVSLAPVSLTATFTATILAHTRDAPGALAFLRFLVGTGARRALGAFGFEMNDLPSVHGQRAPAGLLAAAGGP
jgi:molybdate/tungstate transport system substrate-binding protein